MAEVRWTWFNGRRPSGAVLHSSREPCSYFVDMLRRLINCRIITVIIKGRTEGYGKGEGDDWRKGVT